MMTPHSSNWHSTFGSYLKTEFDSPSKSNVRRIAPWILLALLCAETPALSGKLEYLPELKPTFDIHKDVAQRTLVVCDSADQSAKISSARELIYSYDDPKDKNNEQYAEPLAYDNQVKLTVQAPGVIGLNPKQWYGFSAWLRYPVNQNRTEMDLLRRAAKTFGCRLRTTGPKITSGNFARYRRLVDSADRVGLNALVDDTGRYWMGFWSSFIDPLRRRSEGYFQVRLRVFDTLEKRWTAPETLGTLKEPIDDLQVFPVGRGMQLLYTIRAEFEKDAGPNPKQVAVSRLRAFHPRTGEFRDVLATQWTMGLTVWDLNSDGFFEYLSGPSDHLKKTFAPKYSGLRWNDSLQRYLDLNPARTR
jgi:hypothetical protein